VRLSLQQIVCRGSRGLESWLIRLGDLAPECSLPFSLSPLDLPVAHDELKNVSIRHDSRTWAQQGAMDFVSLTRVCCKYNSGPVFPEQAICPEEIVGNRLLSLRV
jgi:hypothetical protein